MFAISSHKKNWIKLNLWALAFFSEKDVANQNAFFCYQMKNENYNEWKKIKTLLFLQEHKHSLKTSILKVNCTNILRVLDNKREYLMGLHNT